MKWEDIRESAKWERIKIKLDEKKLKKKKEHGNLNVKRAKYVRIKYTVDARLTMLTWVSATRRLFHAAGQPLS